MDVVYLDSSVLVELLLGSEERRQIIKSIIAGKNALRLLYPSERFFTLL